MKTNIRKLTSLALLATIALTIFVLESAIPAPVAIPGVKLGLANIVTLFILMRTNWKDAALVLFVRVILATIFAGQAVSFLYSICGGVLCLIVMAASHWVLKKQAIVITSIFGAIAHNIGQIAAAYFMLRLSGILAYIPVLIVSGIVTGLFTGVAAYYANKYIPATILVL